jgi:hypothetical protein
MMAKYGSDKLGWVDDPKEAASTAMERMARDRFLLEVVIMRWYAKEDGVTEQKIPAFRLERI